jgi:hypothetical protein
MSPLQARDFGLDADRAGAADSPVRFVRRRLAGRYAVDPFGLDPQLADMLALPLERLVRFEIEGAHHLHPSRPATLVMNRGWGVLEPTVLAVAVRQATGRRLRVVGVPRVPGIDELLRRFGAVHATPEDVTSVLRAGHLLAVPLAPTWLRAGAGTPPLELVQAMMGYAVHPVAVSPGGPFGTAVRPWRVRIAAAVPLDGSYPLGDPLGAAELAEEVRAAVEAMLRGDAEPAADRMTAGLVAGA